MPTLSLAPVVLAWVNYELTSAQPYCFPVEDVIEDSNALDHSWVYQELQKYKALWVAEPGAIDASYNLTQQYFDNVATFYLLLLEATED